MTKIYRRLPDDQIRLLCVTPGAHERDLCFNFVYCTPGSIEYTAISYTWGGNAASEKIKINGHSFPVRPNVWGALHTIGQVWQYIWIDAVCIDQTNTAEKNSQVRGMRFVYQSADVVSVWLGHVLIPDFPPVENPAVTIEVDDYNWCEDMDNIASRPYWSRCWVVQEFLLARDIRLYCGNTTLDYNLFQTLLSNVTHIKLLSDQPESISDYANKLRRWPALGLVIERHVDRYPDIYQSLYELLVNHPNAMSTDPRDRVYSLLGLLDPEERHLLERSFPDYKLALDKVNILTLAHIKYYNLKKLDALCFAALHIVNTRDIQRLLRIVDQLDYLGSDDPAVEVEIIYQVRDAGSQSDYHSAMYSPSHKNSGLFSRLWQWYHGH